MTGKCNTIFILIFNYLNYKFSPKYLHQVNFLEFSIKPILDLHL